MLSINQGLCQTHIALEASEAAWLSWAYSGAASPLPKPDGKHGDAFHYKTIGFGVLGWLRR